MADQFRYLLTPLKIGSMTVRNRILVTGHSTLFSDSDSLFSERDARYFAERARGGAGLIVTGATSVHPTSATNRLYPTGYKKEIIPRYKTIADMVHEHGGRILVQLRHCGHLTDTGVFDDWRQVWAPSPVAAARVRVVPKEMELEDVEEVVEAFALCAAYAQAGGVDGVELHGASGYLLEEFMSPLINRRTDEYGGELENRLRLVHEIIDRIRERCGRGFVLGIRICGDELVPGGLTLEDAKEIAQRLAGTDKLDYIDVIAGTAYSLLKVAAPMDVPQGFAVPLAAAIKQVVKGVPIFTGGRITDPAFAEKVLADGHADMVGMTRAHICDPEIGNKAREGRPDEIRTCVSCNQACLGRNRQGRPITCIQNVAAGREKDLGMGTLKVAGSRKLVMVAGGGPAGMEAARVAALRGHQVLLYERAERLGGQVNLAAKVRSTEGFGGVARNLIQAINRLGIEVKLGQEVTAELVKQISPDVVIVTTGSVPSKSGPTLLRPDLLSIPGAEQENVLTIFDVLQETVEVGDHVVVVDEDGHQRAAGTAEFLADKGKRVEIITAFPSVAIDLVATDDQAMYYNRLPKKGVTFSHYTAVKEISGNTVVVYTTYTKAERRIESVDHVVLAMGNRANSGLYRSLKGLAREIYAAGDCVEPRRVPEAIYEAHMIARKI